ncbi:Uncharacterised nucleotidyltransferase [Paenibacillus sp. 1_12]|uniref:nucleotidyltransferase domain-containing protein n=1 Tax=Paenibacillus sp. 1_12 TaxID=1566278 RepID=UPI0008E0B9FE|nr:nucleotidyltransferase family protein [Paenibacillus sp. 1_12]SFL15921.1 Uncharacterised nucleotidyltransferase [Paenibacillus sp. 1_12]
MGNKERLHWGSLSKELRLLLFMMGPEQKDANHQNDMELFQNIDWEHFLNLVSHHRLFSLVYKKIRTLDKQSFPTQVVQTLQQEYKLNTYEMLHLSGEMERLCRQLSEALIDCLFLKGPILATELYGDLSLRSSCDLDILVHLKDLDRAEQLLLNQGYVKDDYFSTKMNDWKWRHHHITFIHPHRGIKVEVHWRLNPGPSIEPCFEQLWERKRAKAIKNGTLYFLGKEDLFLFLTSHGARHGWSRLRWLVDIDRLSKQSLDWNHLNGLLRKFEVSHVAGQALILCTELLHTPLTSSMLPLTENRQAKRLAVDALFYLRQMVNLHTDPLPDDVAKFHKLHLFALRGIRSKLLFIISFLYPYPIDAETLPLPKGIQFLYFPLRPLLWLWRTTRKYATSGRI